MCDCVGRLAGQRLVDSLESFAKLLASICPISPESESVSLARPGLGVVSLHRDRLLERLDGSIVCVQRDQHDPAVEVGLAVARSQSRSRVVVAKRAFILTHRLEEGPSCRARIGIILIEK